MKLNFPLVLGLLLLILLSMVILFPHNITTINPFGMQGLISGIQDGKYTLATPPFPPSKDHLLGTDQLGRDLFSFIIYGTRLTLGITLLVVAGRFLLALLLGLVAGFGNQAAQAITNLFSALFTAMPALIMSIIILSMNFFRSLDKTHSIIAFVIILIIVGWGKLGLVIMERVKDILSDPFIQGEVAIGKGPMRLAVENVLPHLAAELVVLFFMEISSALTMLLQLGVFAVFIGNLRFIQSTDGGAVVPMKVSLEPEWASMLATSRNYLQTASWMVWAPASAFFVTILGFNLFGEGLKRLLQKRDSKFPVYVRTALSFNWQRLYAIVSVRQRSIALAAVVIVSALIVLAMNFDPGAISHFDLSETASVLSLKHQEQIISGTEEAKQTAEDIAKAFGEMGLTPLSQNFISEYPIGDLFIPKFADLKFTGSNGQTKSFAYDRDYTVTGFGEFELEGKIYDAREEDLYSGKNYSNFTDKFVLFDSSYYSQNAVETLVEKIMDQSKAKGILVEGKQDTRLPISLGSKVYQGPVLWITPEVVSYLTSAPENDIKLTLQSLRLENMGRNIIGMLPGYDQNLKKETVLIGLSYNYRAGEQGGKEKILLGLELVKKLASQKEMRTRNIVIAFWDGTLSEGTNGLTYYARNPLSPKEDTVLYLDLSQINEISTDTVVVYTQVGRAPEYFAWGLGHQLETNFNQSGITVVDNAKGLSASSSDMFYQSSIPTVLVAIPPSGGGTGKFPLSQLGKVLADTIKKNNY